jgi:hypothetical protein
MSSRQPINLVSRAVVVRHVEEQGRLWHDLQFGNSLPFEVTQAINTLPVRLEPDYLDLAKVCNTLHAFHTRKMIGRANRGLKRAETMIKRERVRHRL